MAGCFDKTTCSVDQTTGALTVQTKNGSCTIIPGDNVNITETPEGWIITVNEDSTFIPKVEPGSDVDFTETPTEYIITIDNVPHVIPKCNRIWVSCSGRYLDPCVDRIVACDEFYDMIYTDNTIDGDGSQSNPLSINAFTDNTIDGNGKQGNPLSINVFTDDTLDGTGKENDPLTVNFDCLPSPIQIDGCGTTQQVVMQNNGGGCYSLGVLSAAAKKVRVANALDDGVNVPERTDVYIWPDDFGSSYERLDAATAKANNTINESIMRNNVVAAETFTLACATKFNRDLTTLVSQPGTVTDAYGTKTVFSDRWRVDGGAWNYPDGNDLVTNGIAFTATYNSLNEVINRSLSVLSLPAGEIEYQQLAFSVSGSNPTKLKVGKRPASLGGVYRGPTTELTPVTE